MSAAEEIKSKLDIVNFIQQYVPLKKAGRTFKACCPFHSEKTASFVVNPDNQTWRCFGACAEGGDVFNFAMKYHNWSFSEALQELGNLTGIEVRKQTPEQRSREEHLDKLRGLLQNAADAYHHYLLDETKPESPTVLHYVLEKRGFTHETIQKFAIGYAPPGWQEMLTYLGDIGYSENEVIEAGLAIRNENGRVYDRFRNRLIIPIRDERGRVIGFGGRALSGEDQPKYLNSPQSVVFDKSHTLFGLDAAKNTIRAIETAVIVEGYMDAIQAHQAGFTNVVAQMGTAMTEAQLKLLAPRYARKIILALDADTAGQNATRRSLDVARETMSINGKLAVDIRVLHIPDAKDPDDFLRETPHLWVELIEKALPIADFVIGMEMSHLKPDASVMEREIVARRLLPILLASENNLHRQDNIQKLALKLKIAEKDLLALATEQRKIETSKPPRPAQSHEDTSHEPPLWSGEPEAQPEFDDGSAPPIIAKPLPLPATKQATKNREMEYQCLRVMLQTPDLFYQLNRKLRELAGNDEMLRNGPLSELGYDDFTEADFRMLMQAFEESLRQDESEPLEYLREKTDFALREELEGLLITDAVGLRHRLRHRLLGEFNDFWKQFEQSRLGQIDWETEMMERGLRLRLLRLQREREDLRFLQMQAADDPETTTQDFSALIIMSTRAKELLEKELNRLQNPASKAGWFST